MQSPATRNKNRRLSTLFGSFCSHANSSERNIFYRVWTQQIRNRCNTLAPSLLSPHLQRNQRRIFEEIQKQEMSENTTHVQFRLIRHTTLATNKSDKVGFTNHNRYFHLLPFRQNFEQRITNILGSL